MATPVFIGDELTAAGFRLAGLRALAPEDAALEAVFREAVDTAETVLVTAEFAQRLPPALLEATLRAERPMLAIVPDVRGRAGLPDLSATIRRALGVEA